MKRAFLSIGNNVNQIAEIANSSGSVYLKDIDDLLKELQRQGYGIKRGKYISIKVKQNRKPIRSFRLGDGYALEHLEYRIEHKNLEMPLSEALKYSGIQREYALCIRQIQIQLYRCPEAERLHFATYREVERSSRLLFYLRDNNVHSADDFRKAVSDAKAEIENIRREEERQRSELERGEVQEERKPQSRGRSEFSI